MRRPPAGGISNLKTVNAVCLSALATLFASADEAVE